MKLSISKQVMLSTAVASALIAMSATGAFAQQRVDNGNARDANNRVGSGGYNGGGSGSTNPYAVNGNSIVTGNVTGGREFRGFVPYTDPGAFRGETAGGGVDRFVRSSAGAPIGINNNNNAQNVTTYYGDSRAAPPPPGFVQSAPGQMAYVPSLPQGRTTGDIRLGNPFETIEVTQPRPGQLVLPGPVDSAQQPTVITASPLYGVRQWKFGDQASEDFLQNYTDVYNSRRPSNQYDAQTLERMRNELNNQVEPQQVDPNDPNGSADGSGGAANVTNGVPNANAPLNGNINDPNAGGANPQNDPNGRANGGADGGANGTNPNTGMLSNQSMNSGLTNQPLSNNIRTEQGMRNRLLTVTPKISSGSPQYRALQERMRRMQSNPQMAEVNANREFRSQQLAMDEANKANGGAGANPNNPNAGAKPQNPNGAAAPGADKATPPTGGGGGGGGGATPGNAATPTVPGTNQPVLPGVADAKPQPNAPTGAGDRPVMIKSFTADMKDSAVVTLMKDAEQQMRDGKYTTALDKYDMVEQVVPNDPLVLLGRATAELGASYYTRADGHLREAFTKNPALLMGQYDLHTFLGDDRLAFLVKDLKDLANKNKSDPRPVFLLSYIAYNTGNERNAAAYLDLAEKRTNGKDPFFATIRKNWTLPEGAGAPDLGGGGGAEMNK